MSAAVCPIKALQRLAPQPRGCPSWVPSAVARKDSPCNRADTHGGGAGGARAVNLYIVFANSVSAKDMVTNVVVLDFIFEQLPKYKTSLLKGDKSKAILLTIKTGHFHPPVWTASKMLVRTCKAWVLQAIQYVAFFAIISSAIMIAYGPICKPGEATAGLNPQVKGSGAVTVAGSPAPSA